MPYADPEAKRAADRRRSRTHAHQKRAAARASHRRNREANLARMRARRAEDPEADRQRCREWRENHAEEKRAADRAYYVANAERIKARVTARNRVVRRGGVEAAEYRDVLLADPCSYCGAPASTVDHIEPVATGGENGWGNFTAACRTCNARKHTRPLLLFLIYRPL